MDNDLKNGEELTEDEATKGRREFLKKAGKFGITAPMAYLLLSVDKKASACATCYAHTYVLNGNDK